MRYNIGDRIESIREADEKIKRNKPIKKRNSNINHKNTRNVKNTKV